MADRSKIEWTEASWNPIRAANKATGRDGHFCVHVSEGCRNCYAERMQARFGNPVRFAAQDRDKVQVFLHETALTQPLRWKRPRRIFPCSMTDIAGDWVVDEMLDRMFAVMALTPWHTYQVLTKRPDRMRAYLQSPDRIRRIYGTACDLALETDTQVVLIAPGVDPSLAPPGPRVHLDLWPLPNVWLGTSVEDQLSADVRIPELLSTPAAVRWISAEPLLGPMDVSRFVPRERFYMMKCEHCGWVGSTEHAREARNGDDADVVCGGCGKITLADEASGLDWVVAGGESGPKARPMHPDWARSLRDQCAAAGVPFFFKQWGEHCPAELIDDDRPEPWRRHQNGAPDGWGLAELDTPREDLRRVAFYAIGKKAAGRLLDGVAHNGYPEVPPRAQHAPNNPAREAV